MKTILCLTIICMLTNLGLYSQNKVIGLDFKKKKQPEAQLHLLIKEDTISLTSISKNIFIDDFSENATIKSNHIWKILIRLKRYYLIIELPNYVLECNDLKIRILSTERYLLSYCGAYGITGFYQKLKIKQDNMLIKQEKNNR